MSDNNASIDILIEKIKKIMPCSCIDAYKMRGLSAPDCAYCNYVDDIADMIMKEREIIISSLREIKKRRSANTEEWNCSVTGSAINKAIDIVDRGDL